MDKEKSLFGNAILIFLLVQAFGLFSGYYLENQIEPTDVFLYFSLGDLLPEITFGLLLGILILVFLYFMRNNKNLLKIFFGIFLFVGSFYIFQIYFQLFLALLFSMMLVILWLKLKKVWVHNLAIGLVICGLGVDFGNMIPTQMILIILAVLSLYDFYAVLKTKVLVKVFSGLASHGMVLAMIIPARLQNLNEEYDHLSPNKQFFYLGTGDLLLPLMLAVSLIGSSLASAFLVSLGAATGLGFLYFYIHVLKITRPMPALPPIAFFSIIGFIISIFI
ncbi:MAG: presenilin family intramembrane aspartyl protease [Patescibacteria group bacterium]|nr:hypothetical protein [Patescibacteria group bacterium]